MNKKLCPKKLKCLICKRKTEKNHSILPNNKIVLCQKCFLGKISLKKYFKDVELESFTIVIEKLYYFQVNIFFSSFKKYNDKLNFFCKTILFLEKIKDILQKAKDNKKVLRLLKKI